MSEPRSISPAAAFSGAPGIVLDVRTAAEHAAMELKAKHMLEPLGSFDAAAFIAKNNIGAEQPVYVLCRSGKRAAIAAASLAAAGHANTHVIEGGILACEAAGIPVKNGEVISLERQVRIAAGLMVAAGSIAAIFVSPLWAVVPAFVGAGLVFAGVTDRCGLALALTAMPWNKAKAAPASCATPAGAATCSVNSAAGGNCAGGGTTEMKQPSGIAFYSPASGAPQPLQLHALTPVGKTAGGCS